MTALLALLAVDGKPHSREVLTALLFPEQDERRAKANFRQTLSLLRGTIGGGFIQSDGNIVQIVPNTHLWVDVIRFRRHLQAFHVDNTELPCDASELESLSDAVDLYQGEFLEGLIIGNSLGFEEWLSAEREELRKGCAAALRRLIEHDEAAAEYEEAIGLSIRLLELDSMDESVHRNLMSLYMKAGRYRETVKQYDRCRTVMFEELGREPCLETEQVYREARRGDTRTVTPHTRDTPFVGRRREIAKLEHDLSEARAGKGGIGLVTGEPGIGKTRLALELRERAELVGMQVLWGQCYEGAGTPPYWSWEQVLRSCLDRHGEKDVVELLGPNAPLIAGAFPNLCTYVSSLTDADADPAPDGPRARFRFFDAVTAIIERASTKQPTVIVIEDLQWADTLSLLFLEFLTQFIYKMQLLFVGTCRDTEIDRDHPFAATLGTLPRRQRCRPYMMSINHQLGFIQEPREIRFS